MKHKTNKTILLASLAVAAFAAGCDKPDTTSQQLDKLQEKTAAAVQDLQEQDYTYAQKAEFTEKMKAQLAEINEDIDQLEIKIEKSSDAVKAEAKPKLQALREKAAELTHHLEAAGNATESTWDSVKAGSQKAYEELKDGFNQARQWVSEKIAP